HPHLHSFPTRRSSDLSGDAERFFDAISGRSYRSSVAQSYQERLEKNRHKLFTFLSYDSVPWNNNNAEHAIKKFAYYREIADGLRSEEHTSELQSRFDL